MKIEYSEKFTKLSLLGMKVKWKNKIPELDELVNMIKNHIDDPKIKVVSFDIFDTLLVRHSLNPKDILKLIGEVAKAKYKVDIKKNRLEAEAVLNNPNATIDDIYDYICRQQNLSKDLKKQLILLEEQIENQCLIKRQDVFNLYEYALKKRKRVIAVSDMYLSSDFLEKTLKEKSYDKIQKIYVSNECMARKNDGKLFDFVLAAENIKGAELLHIGDNFMSDYVSAKKKNIKSVYYPSIVTFLVKQNPLFKMICEQSNQNFYTNILYGFALNRFYNSQNESKVFNKKLYANLTDVINLFIAPTVLFIALKMHNHKMIQSAYSKLFFAARDGYLPMLVYNTLSEAMDSSIPSEYLYGSRRAYLSGSFSSFEEIFYDVSLKADESYTFMDFILSYVNDCALANSICSSESEAQNYSLVKQKDKVLIIIRKYADELNRYLQEEFERAKKYYQNKIGEEARAVVFDTGYGGSVSAGIGNYVNTKIDKCYVFENSKNRMSDMKNATLTYVLCANSDYDRSSLGIVLEELFSPLEGGCKGFVNENGEIKPIFDSFSYREEMRKDACLIQEDVVLFAKEFSDCFKDALDCFYMDNIEGLFRLYRQEIVNENASEILKNIIFPDFAVLHTQQDLGSKIRKNK